MKVDVIESLRDNIKDLEDRNFELDFKISSASLYIKEYLGNFLEDREIEDLLKILDGSRNVFLENIIKEKLKLKQALSDTESISKEIISELGKDIINLISIINKNTDDLEATEEEFGSLDKWSELIEESDK